MTPDELGAYTCEVQVLDVHVKANFGPTIKLRFADKEQASLFRKGQRLAIACVEIGDDEEVVPETRERPTIRRPYTASQLAGMCCDREDFRRWIYEAYGDRCDTTEEAADWVRRACGIASRSALDAPGTSAVKMWQRLLAEFDAWGSRQ